MKRDCLALIALIVIVSRVTSIAETALQLLKQPKQSDQPRSFIIDYDHDTFLKDGQPFTFMSGSLHYSRVHYGYWEDRLLRMYSAGLDAVQTYVMWNTHEPQPGIHDFAGQQNITRFLQTAQDIGLLVILRAGPYICGNWDYGGLPGWLLKDNSSFTVRSMDPVYLAAVDRWLSVLLPIVRPFLYSNGGPIITVQVENEYGSYDCNHGYMGHLRDTFSKYLGGGSGDGSGVVLFTTDGNNDDMVYCGSVDGVYATVDFGPSSDVEQDFAPMRKKNPKGPLVNSELYPGWQDYWYQRHQRADTQPVVTTLQGIRKLNASVNMYMFEGGTTFGYWNGADFFGSYSVAVTSYDYDAPLTEAGDVTAKYMSIRNLNAQVKLLPPVPPNNAKSSYGPVHMYRIGSVHSLLENITAESQPMATHLPVNMEQTNTYFGFVLYRHVVDRNYPTSQFSVPGIRDRGYVLLDGVPLGVVDRTQATSFNMFATVGQTLDILVENQGRIAYSKYMNYNRKGIISNVTFDGRNLTSWTIYPINLTKVFDLPNDLFVRPRTSIESQLVNQPSIYVGSFTVTTTVTDTFFKMCGWSKGQLFINGFNVGRYWPVAGPQVTLYIPSPVLLPSPQLNKIVMFELEKAPSTSQSSSYVHRPFVDNNQYSNTLFFSERSSAATAVDAVEFVDEPVIDGICFR